MNALTHLTKILWSPLTRILLLGCLFFLSCDAEVIQKGDVAFADITGGKVESTSYQLDKDYWYAGSAEIATYDLKQNRYNALHDGEQVMIFVTEDFLTDKQVKNDNYVNKSSVSVLKTNMVRRFTTGLYDYSMMTSVFTRADGSKTEKVTLSSQDWCGQSFAQLNNKGGKFQGQLRSYFESEGDKEFVVKADLIEDEIFNFIRISPDLIPEGSVSILPSMVSLRLTHDKYEVKKAIISKGSYSGSDFQGENLAEVLIEYENIDRLVRIIYESSKPRKIIGFEELRPSLFDKKKRQTLGRLQSIIMEPYWKMNQLSDTTRREPMGLDLY